MTDLKDSANPNFGLLSDLAKATNEQNELLVLQGEFLGKQNDLADIQIVLLDRLCTLKEEQQESDNAFRASWWARKLLDHKASMVVLFVMVFGVGLDMVKVNSNSSIVNWLSNLLGV